MPSFKELLTFEYENEYESAYDLSVKRNFIVPKIYTTNVHLNKGSKLNYGSAIGERIYGIPQSPSNDYIFK